MLPVLIWASRLRRLDGGSSFFGANTIRRKKGPFHSRFSPIRTRHLGGKPGAELGPTRLREDRLISAEILQNSLSRWIGLCELAIARQGGK
jgi:hypothetical protein